MPPSSDRVRWTQRASPFAWWCPVCRSAILRGAPVWLAWTSTWGVGMHRTCRASWTGQPESVKISPELTPQLSLAFLPLLAVA